MIRHIAVGTLLAIGAASAAWGQGSFITPPAPKPKPKPAPAPAPAPAKAPVANPAATPTKPAPAPSPVASAPAKAAPAGARKSAPPAKPQSRPAEKPAEAGKPALPAGTVQVATAGTGLLVGGRPVMLAGLAVRPAPELQGRMDAWLARNGGTVRCSSQGSRYQCVTPYGSDLGGALVVSGFAVPEPDASPAYQALAAAVRLRATVAGNDPGPALSSVLAGTANLNCQTLGCRTRYIFKGYGRNNTAIARQDWKGLAENIVAVNFANDIDFYYLGRTAEALGAYSAAATYYSKALNLFQSPNPNDHCSSLQGLPACGGIDLGQQLPALTQGAQEMAKFEF